MNAVFIPFRPGLPVVSLRLGGRAAAELGRGATASICRPGWAAPCYYLAARDSLRRPTMRLSCGNRGRAPWRIPGTEPAAAACSFRPEHDARSRGPPPDDAIQPAPRRHAWSWRAARPGAAIPPPREHGYGNTSRWARPGRAAVLPRSPNHVTRAPRWRPVAPWRRGASRPEYPRGESPGGARPQDRAGPQYPGYRSSQLPGPAPGQHPGYGGPRYPDDRPRSRGTSRQFPGPRGAYPEYDGPTYQEDDPGYPASPDQRYPGYPDQRHPGYPDQRHPASPDQRHTGYGGPPYPRPARPQHQGYSRPRTVVPSRLRPALPAGAPRPSPGRTAHGKRNAPLRRRRAAPRGHWVLFALSCAAIGISLVLNGYTRGALSQEPGSAGPVDTSLPPAPASVRHGGPIVEAGSSPPRSLVMPRRVIALTFDGGPDPRWTPQILAVLQRFGAHATFFETGAHAAQYPALSRTVLRDGNEIGTDTYTHADLGTAGWRRGPELTLAQNALAGAAGIHTRLLRLPYWPSQRTLDGPEWQALREAGREGYLVAFADRDTRDWSRARAGAIVARAMPHAHRGEIVTMQDGGTDGRHTVAVLSRLLKRLRGRGYRFTTITGGLGMPSADVPATARQRDTGGALLLALRISADVVTVRTLLLVITAVRT